MFAGAGRRAAILLPALALLLVGGGPLRGTAGRTASLTIVADNVRGPRGVVGILVFASPRGWPEAVVAAVRATAVPAHAGTTTLVVRDLPVGTYAVVALHDENENMKLDKNWLGMPKEGWGMSRNPSAHGAAPSYQRARFELSADTRLDIRMNY